MQHELSSNDGAALRHWLTAAWAGFFLVGLVLAAHAVDVVLCTREAWLARAVSNAPADIHSLLADIAKWGWSLFIACVCLWMLQAIRISRVLGGARFVHSPISAFWVWLTPLYNFYRPYELLRDMHTINQQACGDADVAPPRQIMRAKWVFIISSVIDLCLPLDGLLAAFSPPPAVMTAVAGGDMAGLESAISGFVAAQQYVPAKIYAVADFGCYVLFGWLLLHALGAITDGQRRAIGATLRQQFTAGHAARG